MRMTLDHRILEFSDLGFSDLGSQMSDVRIPSTPDLVHSLRSLTRSSLDSRLLPGPCRLEPGLWNMVEMGAGTHRRVLPWYTTPGTPHHGTAGFMHAGQLTH